MGRRLAGERRKFVSLAMCMVFLLVAGQWQIGRSADDNPLAAVKASVQEILRILKDPELGVPARKEERQKQVVAVVDNAFDFREMAQHTMAGHWEKQTPAEQDRFVELFSQLVKNRYIDKIDNYTGQEVVFTKERVQGDKALIYSTLVDKGTDIPIIYRLFKKGDTWLVFDLKIENVSLVANYREDFFSIIKKDGYNALVKRMEEKLQSPDKVN